jgi:CubicO group peptidase (beta-lactamase class C family)
MRWLTAGGAIAIAVAFIVILGLDGRAQAPFPTSSWPASTPAAEGLDPALFAAIASDITSGAYGNIDRVFVTRHGRAVVNDAYPRDYRAISRGQKSVIGCGEGCDDPAAMHEFNYFHPNWHPYYQGRPVHTLQSVTKSIAATVVGIGVGRGEITGVDRPFLPYFADKNLAKIDPRLRAATLDDLLTMRSGIEWHEQDRPLDATNTTVQLEASRDWIQFTLDQPMDAAPGAKWAYNSGASHLMSGIVKSATGRFIDDYASEHLFAPIGIKDFHWKKTPTGHPDTEGGLYLSAEDLARVGYLYLRDGMWNGRRVLPEGWVRRATTRRALAVGPGWDYGYQWWITSRQNVDVWAGRGFGGQTLLVISSRDIVAVVNAWNVFGDSARNLVNPLIDALLAPPAKGGSGSDHAGSRPRLQ